MEFEMDQFFGGHLVVVFAAALEVVVVVAALVVAEDRGQLEQADGFQKWEVQEVVDKGE